jgi:gas vesicle protein
VIALFFLLGLFVGALIGLFLGVFVAAMDGDEKRQNRWQA